MLLVRIVMADAAIHDLQQIFIVGDDHHRFARRLGRASNQVLGLHAWKRIVGPDDSDPQMRKALSQALSCRPR